MGSIIPSIYKGPGYGTIYGDSEIREAIAFAEVLQKLAAGSPSVFDDYKGPGYGTIYGDSELIPAIAIAEVMQVLGVGIGGGSGFTYDQETEPSDPITGDTWRERDGDNLIIGDWFWNGTYWLSLELFESSLSRAIGGTGIGEYFIFPSGSYNVFVESAWVCFLPLGNTNDGDNYWDFQFTLGTGNFGVVTSIASINTSAISFNSTLSVRLSTAPNIFLSLAGTARFIFMVTSAVGAPTATIDRFQTGVSYRIARS